MSIWIRDRDDQGTINDSQETSVKTKIKFISYCYTLSDSK